MSVLENSGDDSTGDAVAAPFRSCERSPVMWQGVDEVLRGSNNFAPAPHAPNPAAMITDDLDVQIKPALYDPLKRYVFTDSLFPSLFGTVVVAWDRLQERTVAIKLSNIDLVKMRRSSKGIPVHENPLLEAEVMRQISTHPSIVLLNDEHVAGNVHWMVMEYVPCGDLFDHMRTQGRMEPAVARKRFLQLADAVVHIHTQGICHMDISMENLLLDLNGDVKLSDFGAARRFAADGGAKASLFPGFKDHKPGKLRYMAPEVLAGAPCDGRAVDTFALGVVLFCMLVGSAPFEKAHPSDQRWHLISTKRISKLLELIRVQPPSASAIHLMEGLMCAPERRLTMDQVMKHPWMRGEL